MNNIDDSLSNRRVPFIYHTLLYKLDNIHLKLKCQRKRPIPPHSDRKNGLEIQELLGSSVLKVSNTPVECGLSSINQETRYDEKETELSGDKRSLESENKDNTFSNGNIGNKQILYDSDSGTASDLSIDGCHESYNHLSKSISQKDYSRSDYLVQDCCFGPADNIQEPVTLYDIENKSNVSEEWELEQVRPYSKGTDEILQTHYENETKERKNKALRKKEKESDLKTEDERSLELMNTVHKSYSENLHTDDIENNKPFQRETVLKSKIENSACSNELNCCGVSQSRVSPTSAQKLESTNCPQDKPAIVDDTINVLCPTKTSGANSIKDYNRGSSSLLTDDTLLSNHLEVQQTKRSLMNSRISQSNNSISEGEPFNAGILNERTGKSSNSQSGSASQYLKFKEQGTCSNKLLKNSPTGRQNGLFVKEFDNSFSLISDLLSIGSSPKRRESAESLRKDRAQIISTGKICREERYDQETCAETGKSSRLYKSDASWKFDRENENQCTLDTEKQCIPVNEKQFVLENKKHDTSDNKNGQTLNNEQHTPDSERQYKSDNEKDSLDMTLTEADYGKSKTNYKRNHFFASSLPDIIKSSGDDKKDWNLSMDEKRPRNLQMTKESTQKLNEIDCYNSLIAKLEQRSKLSKKMNDEKTKLDTRNRKCIKECKVTRNATTSILDNIGKDNEEDKHATKTVNESTQLLRNGAINTDAQGKLTDSSTEYQDKIHNALPIDEHTTSISQTEEKNTDKTEIANKSQKGVNRSFEKSQIPKADFELNNRLIDEVGVQPFQGKDEGIKTKFQKQLRSQEGTKAKVNDLVENGATAYDEGIKSENYIQTKTMKVDERVTYDSPTQTVIDAERSNNENPTQNQTTMYVIPDELPLDKKITEIQQTTIIEMDKETISGVEKKTTMQRETDLEIIRTLPEKSITTETISTPIIIKRLERPDTSKLKKKDKRGDQGKDPYASLQFKVLPSSSVGSKYFEDFSPKVIAESLANLPMIGGKDVQLPCPTCTKNVFSDGKIVKSDCMDPVHQMLMQIPSLQSVAGRHGLVVRNIAGDGNCMFHAVIDQLRIAGDFTFNKDTLRSKSVEYLRENPCQEDGSHLMCFLSTESWEEYLNRMNRDGEWGDHMILNAITEVIGRTVTVLNNSGNVTHLFPHTVTLSDEVTLDSVYLGHVGMHYVSLRPKDWEKTWAMNAKIRRMSKYLEQRQEMSDLSNDTTGGANSDIDRLQCGQYFRGNTDILELLIKDNNFVEPVSRVPVMHLSFIIKKMLRLALFSPPHDHPMALRGGKGMKCEEIGISRIGLNVRLISYAKTMTEQIKDAKDTCNTKYILFPPESHYKIVDNEREIPIFKDDVEPHYLVVDTDQTHPGYLRLKALGPIKYLGDSKGGHITKFISGRYYIYRIPVSFLPDDGSKVNYVGGLGYGNWPYEAVRWINRDRPAEWPRKEVVEKVCKIGCYIRHKSHPGSFEKDVEFQYVFTKAEDILVNDEMTDDMRYCFCVFKALMTFQTKNIGCRLPNYLMITVLLYACESIPADTWRNSCGGYVGDIEDTELKSQIVKSNLKQTNKYLTKLQRYYWIMAICFKKMDKVQLFQEFILEYEEVIEQMPKKNYVAHLSSMWKKLNNPEKAKEVERKMECLLEEEEDHEFSRNLMKLLIKLSS
ncbi:unnamed protein product [Mytilus coruscus]|uniref:OTU domain-containing protein n=1 Tax=Mytilus coruscus TaxID=42192 RepID=A0A6J8C6W1_MYTCO|nr:unnamed protein product [Mytilus coruscus]